MPITILILAIYCALMSGLFMAVAFWKPRYGKRIGPNGGVAASTATLLSALFAKTVELSYVTVCVAFLGQVLSRRAITKGSRGISISDMNMRAWIMQPGSLIVHWETLRYSALTILGIFALTAALVSMLYTTAAEALVAPKLMMMHADVKHLVGTVSTQFAVPLYLEKMCQTPVTTDMDPVYSGQTCVEIEHVGQAYHNYQEYIAAWSELADADNGTSTRLASRLPPVGAMYDNTSVTGSWIDIQNMTKLSAQYGRLVNNVTAALPHGGIIAAAQDPRNGIRQPDGPSGKGMYHLEASVPSPSINVLCVGMTAEELSPLVYTEWPDSNGFNATTWNPSPPENIPVYPDWLNRTVVDDIFGFGEKYGQRPPIFGKFPQPYNTILNGTGLYDSNALYILAAPPTNVTNPEYVLCALKAKQTGVCSTRYSAAASGAALSTHCNSPANKLQYNHVNPKMIEGVWKADWKNVATLWAEALSLGAGITDGQSSNARLLTQMTPASDSKADNNFSLNPKLPSIAEALAAMASSTLILSSQGAPFVPFFNYTPNKDGYLNESVTQSFPARVSEMDYASGPSEPWQCAFYAVLVAAFITSAICLVFILIEIKGRQVTDFTEPANLFTLAVNSPPSGRLRGACGAGPSGTQLSERWYVGMEEDHEHYFIQTKAEEDLVSVGQRSSGVSLTTSAASSPYLHRGSRSSSGLVSVETFDVDDSVPLKSKPSPRVNEYRVLSSPRGLFSKLY